VRNFLINPSARYIDTPLGRNEGTCVQVCSYAVEGIEFSELEYHSPAVGFGTGLTEYLDCSQLWAYRGTAAEIEGLTERLLGVSGIRL
jgi:hypothetical protein